MPVPRALSGHAVDLAHAARYVPLAGVCDGALAAAVHLAASRVWPPGVAALASIAATLVATGARHDFGLADSC
ncbi:adenosylcobinamide-GDP ribazoletransferase, partial [Burkholderia pseudomallei]